MIFRRAEPEPEPHRPKRILVYGDSTSWGWVPRATFIPTGQFPASGRWPQVMETVLGQGYEVVVDALSGRTTDTPDPLAWQIPGVGLDGNACLPASLGANLPLDLVILMLGSNDLKPQFGRSAFRIALGAGMLIDTVQRSANLFGTRWYSYPAPKVLLVCPPPLGKIARVVGDMFAGAEDRAGGLVEAYQHVAAAAGEAFFDAGSVVRCDGADGVHLTAESQRRLGQAIAERVQVVLGAAGDA